MAVSDDRKYTKAFVYDLLEGVKGKTLGEVDSSHQFARTLKSDKITGIAGDVIGYFNCSSFFNLPHTIFVVKQKLALANTRIVDVARMLKTTMLRVEVPPMCGNDATAYTHPAFVFNIGMCNQKFAEFNRCNPIHRK